MLSVGKKAKILLFIACYCCASLAFAVGFGNLTVRSSANQPLLAEIQLTGIKNVDPFSIQATLASPTDFDRAGVARAAELYNLIFEISTDRQRPAIIVKSLEPIQVPVIEFLVELVWSDGKLVKQFNIYLEPSSKKKTTKKQTRMVPTTHIATELLPDIVPDIDENSSELNRKVDITKHELYRTPVISKTKATIKTDAASIKPTSTSNKQKEANESQAQIKMKPQKISQNTPKQVESEIITPAPQIVPEIPVMENVVMETSDVAASPLLIDAPAEISLQENSPTIPLELEKALDAKPQVTAAETTLTKKEQIVQQKITTPAAKKIPVVAIKKPLKTQANNPTILLLLGLATVVVTAIALVIRRKYSRSAPNAVVNNEPESHSTAKFTQVITYSRVLQMKIDLAKQYLDIGDRVSARSLLTEVIAVADGPQKSEAEELKQNIS